MKFLNEIRNVLTEILDVEDPAVEPETYIIRELEAESIDLLELAVALNSSFDINVNDDDLFFRNLRLYINEAREQGIDPASFLVQKMPFLTAARAAEIMEDLDGGPVLKVKDLTTYIAWQKT